MVFDMCGRLCVVCGLCVCKCVRLCVWCVSRFCSMRVGVRVLRGELVGACVCEGGISDDGVWVMCMR